MKNYKPIKYFIDNEITNLSAKQIKRNIKNELNKNNDNVRIVLNSKNRLQYEIDLNNTGNLLNRKYKNKSKHIINGDRPNYISLKRDYKDDFYESESHLKGKKKCKNHYNVEVTINLKYLNYKGQKIENLYDKKVYQFIVDKIIEKHSDLMYQIERDKYKNYHLHLGINACIKDVKKSIMNIMYDNFGYFNNEFYNSIDNEKELAIKISPMIDEKLYLKYISKGNDGLGGCLPTINI